MSGIRRFESLAEAVAQGYEVVSKTQAGFLVRIRTSAGYALALVDER